jgi:two-component system response regulator GlrR
MSRTISYRQKILILEDDADMLALVQRSLELHGFRTAGLSSSRTFEKVLQSQSWDLVLVDLYVGEVNALELLPLVLRTAPYARVVVMSAFGSIDAAVTAMKLGAATFVQKTDRIDDLVCAVKEQFRASHGDRGRQMPEGSSFRTSRPLLGSSEAMGKLRRHLSLVAESDACVLIEGESGTGKEVVARAIHENSRRCSGPFEAINCGAIPDNLLEAELFGYRRGAFTDARADSPGLLSECSGGTVFLDEISEMPLDLQVKLLRVIQEREVKAIGAAHPTPIDVRFIAATNENLRQKVRTGQFREDLFYRLSVLPVVISPLRERAGDIPELARYFVALFAERYGRVVEPLPAEVLDRLLQYDWPGNVRELQNSMERGVVLSTDGMIRAEHVFWHDIEAGPHVEGQVGRALQCADPGCLVYAEAKASFERQFLQKLLDHTRGNVSEAARLSGRFRSDLYRLMAKYEVKAAPFKF